LTRQLLHLFQWSHRIELILADDRFYLSALDNTAIYGACSNGHIEIVKLLLADDRVDPSALSTTKPFVTLAPNGHIEIVKLLLADERVDPLALDNKTICHTCYGHTEIVKPLLVDDRVDPSALSTTKPFATLVPMVT